MVDCSPLLLTLKNAIYKQDNARLCYVAVPPCPQVGSTGAVKLFSKYIVFFWDTLILFIIFLTIKINDFRGDVSDVSAKTASLTGSCQV